MTIVVSIVNGPRYSNTESRPTTVAVGAGQRVATSRHPGGSRHVSSVGSPLDPGRAAPMCQPGVIATEIRRASVSLAGVFRCPASVAVSEPR